MSLQFRRGTAAQWTSVNPILAEGEPGFETDTLKFKIGTGSTHWNDLGYEANVSVLAAGLTYRFSDTTGATTSSGRLSFNDATQSEATTVRCNFYDSEGANVLDFLTALDDSSSTLKGIIRVAKAYDPAKWILFALYAIDAQDGWYDLNVSPIAASETNPFVNFEKVVLTFSRTGDKGDDGPDGAPGDPGTPGADGSTILNGSGAPSSGLGVDGDFYIDTAATAIYGPKTAGSWGTPTFLIGAPGDGIVTYRYQSDVPPTVHTADRFYTDRDGVIHWARAGVARGDGNATAQFDLKLNGSSIYSTATKPDCAAGNYIGAERAPDSGSVAFTKGDYLEPVILATGGTQGRITLDINITYSGV